MPGMKIGKHEIFLGDSLELTANIGSRVDICMTDPPYIIGGTSVGKTNSKTGTFADMLNAARFYAQILKECFSVMKDDAVLFMFGNWRSIPTYIKAFELLNENIHSMIVWDKEWIGPSSQKQFRPCWECVAVHCRPNGYIADRSHGDVFRYKYMAVHNATTSHPAEKPVELIKQLIRATGKQEGSIVFDPFLGSGTSVVAAHECNMRGIGIEMNEEYYQIACTRIQAMHNQLTLI